MLILGCFINAILIKTVWKAEAFSSSQQFLVTKSWKKSLTKQTGPLCSPCYPTPYITSKTPFNHHLVISQHTRSDLLPILHYTKCRCRCTIHRNLFVESHTWQKKTYQVFFSLYRVSRALDKAVFLGSDYSSMSYVFWKLSGMTFAKREKKCPECHICR